MRFCTTGRISIAMGMSWRARSATWAAKPPRASVSMLVMAWFSPWASLAAAGRTPCMILDETWVKFSLRSFCWLARESLVRLKSPWASAVA